MNITKKIIYLAALGAMSLCISCADIAFNDPGGFVYNVTNGTGGYLENITIDQWVCSDVAPGESCTAVLYNQPMQVDVSYEAEKVFGQGEDEDVSGSFTMSLPDDTTEAFETITLDEDYFALWISNETAAGIVDRVGYNKDDVGYQSNINNYNFITNYRTVSNEVLERSGDAVSDILEFGTMSALRIYASVEEDDAFKVDVAGQTLSNTLAVVDDSLEEIHILKQSVLIYADGVPVGHDDGEGEIVSDNGGISGSGTINYETGQVSFTLSSVPVTGVTCDFSYNDTNYISLADNIKPGSVVIMAGDTVIGSDIPNANNLTGIVSGPGISGEWPVTYGSGVIQFICETDYIGEPLSCRYAYRIGADNGSGGIVDSGGTIIEPSGGTIDYNSGAIAFNLITGSCPGAAIICDYHRPIASPGSGPQWLGFHKWDGINILTGIFALQMSSETAISDHWEIDIDAVGLQQNSYGSYYLEYNCTD